MECFVCHQLMVERNAMLDHELVANKHPIQFGVMFTIPSRELNEV